MESIIARTRRFSLSAKLLYHLRMADLLFVQWKQLAKTYPRAAVYVGRLYCCVLRRRRVSQGVEGARAWRRAAFCRDVRWGRRRVQHYA
ncbi:hypothetical protein CHLRE_16g667701v5 [Chlamydomonas reinhardtii]|uniref:Uncharacterized protein n=1 Tax=Chlamydomonas reinhardtii TaxID=3055 RepID=A0A2K3CUG5_CHLRE|nr:uncharacterized protein CHLRE_16g667701v5 [Chlamydomonas reinhardtii]PNW71923.1 hypothetical protein CHLRE_16g667701v5 [Chlamydomonas reinhardtii]